MLRKISLISLVVLLTILLVIIVGIRGAFFSYTDPLEGSESIAELKMISLGGMDQYILMRGEDKTKPVLLWLHGGPGAAQMPLARFLDKELEKEFVVVHWDQRGAGKSNHKGFDEETMIVDQFLEDAHELTLYLKKKFGQDKVFLLGHSWGSQLGIELAAKYPEDFHAYIGVSQVVDNYRANTISYTWLKEKIEQKNDRADLKKLAGFGEPPYTQHQDFVAYAMLIDKYGGNFDVAMPRLARRAFRAPEYGLLDYMRWLNGANRGSGKMWDEIYTYNTNFINQIPSLDIPVFFLSGKNDYNTPYQLVKEYYEILEAPMSELIVFENSAHTPFLGEPEKFSSEIIQIKAKLGFKVGNQTSSDQLIDHFEDRIPVLMDRYDIPGTIIALIQKGEITWSNAYGYADLEEGRKMSPTDYCRVESISKSVTAWGVMKLVEQGKIEMDRPVQQYLKSWKFPESEFPEKKITVRQLLSHSAGMPLGTIGVRYSPKDTVPTLKESLTKDAVLIREPGLSFFYSNTGYNLLELLIEEVTGRDFAEYMESEVLHPLGMRHSSFNWSEDFDPPVPFGYDLYGNSIPVYIYPDKAAGGLFATIKDVATFVTAGMTDFSSTGIKVLNTRRINELYTPVVKVPGFYGLAFNSYGFGHFIETLPNGKKAVSHGGQGSGWMTHFYSVPEIGEGIVIFTNSQRSWPFFAHVFQDWAEGRGISSVGMGNIIIATKAVWVLSGLIFLAVVWQLWQLVLGIVTGKRRFAPLAIKFRLLRLVQFTLSLILSSVLIWAVNQDYLFLTSVFPIASGWFGFSIFLFAMLLLLLVLFPYKKQEYYSSN
ncbi:alpha/beta fold hydrolase [Catalinimonas sp. 4WD22]|uniref:alpha/beta fold hydrolase n=1 Tax=Catalinimonas locisalis TaxID=3133978 RepID=UPI003100D614